MIKRRDKPPKTLDVAGQTANHAQRTDGFLFDYAKLNEGGNNTSNISCKFATKIRIELLEALKSHVRRGCPMDTAVLLAAEACDAERTQTFIIHAVDFLSGTNRYGARTSEDFYRIFCPNVKKGISI